MKKRFWFTLVCIFLAVAAFLPAQTASEIEELLGKEAVNYGEAARFVLKAADLIAPLDLQGASGAEDAFRVAAEKQWLPGSASASGTARLDGICLLIMRSFDMSGGLMYTLFRNSHYAYRELTYNGIVQGNSDPAMEVSGDTLLFLIGRMLSIREENEAAREEAAGTVEQQAMLVEINAMLSARGIADSSARITEEGVTISLSNIQFTADSSELPESEKQKLMEIAQILEDIPHRYILVTGHTALAGNERDRLLISQDRAQAVADYLISLGVRKPDEVYSQGLGAGRPIADNSTPQGMAINRRVEITILEGRR